MHSIPFALSIHKYISSVGADVGFASLIAVALLVILYFAQMRETATLRERLDAAYSRIGNLEGRVGQLIQLQQVRAQQPQQTARPGVVPAPVTARPMGSAAASVRRVPATGPAPAALADGLLPAAAAGLGAPALASATKLVPDPIVDASAPGASEDTMFVAPGAANGSAENGGSTAVGMPAVPATAAGGPPRVQIRPEAPIGTVPGRAEVPSRNPAMPPRRFLDEPARDRDWGRRLLLGFGALVAIAAVVVILLALTHKSSPSKPTSKASTTKTTAASTFKPQKVFVSVLNGTGVTGLAGDVAKVLVKKGYKVPSTSITNDIGTNLAIQDQQITVVSYVKGTPKGLVDAQHVAAALGVKAKNVGVATQTAIQSCATSTSGTTTSCTADVIVTLGADKTSFASSSS